MSATYTHGYHPSVLRSHTWRTAENSAAYLLSHLEPGMTILDVGCGPGTITADLAARVAPGRVIALDASETVLAKARRHAAEVGATTITFTTGDVHALDLPDDSVDVVHAHQVLQHVSDPVAALREMRRVCRPGGIVAARDADYAAMTWYPEVSALDEWLELYRAVARANGGEPDAGRRLLAWAHAAGLTDVTPGTSTWCHATVAEREHWGTMWSDRIVDSAIATDAVRSGLADVETLRRLSRAWRDWAAEPDGWFAILHGEILCRA
ncbi:MAG TPA: methyltransferase domain-containing protein [Stackebrandtia sp.]|jgi:2-polyprenyl-3-methyl-5-hydroxy-6-metoxy-1,4-benzoquinol methylase|uniref:methyltransferase domain-containing protein n=1 Tax=Stackebrandtia sp. TaxID=2023065 RepID=UPI002D60E6DD|nr:methyltransferase domain-containing protein [Stackebrandtia sp.]HZE41466.1 methyltransferase domain-containing protein [Stackebrandtia sp.]